MKIKFKKYWRKTSLKNKKDGDFLLKHIEKVKPKNFLEIGVFHVLCTWSKENIDEYVVSKNYNLKILNSKFAEITKKFHNS